MAVDDTLLMREVDEIAARGEGLSNYKLSCRILAGSEWIDPLRIELFSLERDYEGGYGDTIVAELTVGKGTYAYRLIPNRDHLYVDVVQTPLFLNSSSVRSDAPSYTRRYRAIIMNQANPGLVGRAPHASSEEDLNREGPTLVEFQLIDEGIYHTRMITVGRLYRQAIPAIALRSLLTETCRLTDANSRQVIQGVDLADGYNQTVRRHIIIPDGTPLVDVPTLLQEKEGGLYSTGVGCYLQGEHWYVYPLYDVTRYQRTPRTLTLLNIPPNRFAGAEKTYRRTANQVIAVCAGEMKQVDVGLFGQLNQGNAVRFTNADRLLSMAETGGNKAIAKRDQNIVELEGVALKTGFTNARWTAERATSNPFKHYSVLAQRAGRYVQVQWLHGDSSLLYPGMPVKFLTNADGKLVTLYGVLLGVHEQRVPREAGVKSEQYPASVMLNVFLERQREI